MNIDAFYPKRWWILSSICLLFVMFNIDFTAANLALAPIAKDLNADLTSIQWINNIYLLFVAAFMILGGRIGDRLGVRAVLFGGTALFTLSSLAVGLSSNMPEMLLTRAIQGFSVAFAFPLANAACFAAFPKRQQGMVMGILVSIIGFSQSMGPYIGGVLLHYFAWPSIFFVNVPIGLLTSAIMLYALPSNAAQQLVTDKLRIIPRLDSMGASLAISALLILTYGLTNATQWGFESLAFISSMLIAIAIFAACGYHEKKLARRGGVPFINIDLLTDRAFAIVNLVRAVNQYIFFGVLFIMSLYLQNVRGLAPINAGNILLVMTLTFGFVSLVGGKLVDWYGAKPFIVLGMFCGGVGAALLAHVGVHDALSKFYLPLIIIGVSLGFIFPSTNTLALQVVPLSQAGEATGLFYTNTFIGGIAGVALFGFILSHLSWSQANREFLKAGLAFSPYHLQYLKHILSGAQAVTGLKTVTPPSLLAKTTEIVQQSFYHAYKWSLQIASAFAFACALLSWLCLNEQCMNKVNASNNQHENDDENESGNESKGWHANTADALPSMAAH